MAVKLHWLIRIVFYISFIPFFLFANKNDRSAPVRRQMLTVLKGNIFQAGYFNGL